MVLRSKLFTKDPAVRARLNDCLERDSAHIQLGATGPHVSAIQTALFVLLPGLKLPDNELSDPKTKEGAYGSSTAAAVLRYKQNHKPPIINTSYQKQADNIVGKMTIQFLDDDMVGKDPVDPPKPAPSNKGIKTFTFWLNAFINRDVKNANGSPMSFRLATGSHAGETAIPGPFNGIVPGFDDCYLTDQRGFDSAKLASSRIHAEVRIDFTGPEPTLTFLPMGATVDTVRLRVSTGKARGGFFPAGGFVKGSKQVTVRFSVAGKNPIAKMPNPTVVPIPGIPVPVPIPFVTPSSSDPQSLGDPDIDMIGTLTVDADDRKMTLRALVDGFPFFEGYASADGGPPVTIFQKPPDPGENPLTGLPGPPRRVVEVDKRIP